MPETIQLASTTNSEDQIREALNLPPEQEEASNGNGHVTPKAEKYIKKLTARAKAAEEELAALKAQLADDGKQVPPNVDRRIDKLTAQKHALARERDELRARLASNGNGAEQTADTPSVRHENSVEDGRFIETLNTREEEATPEPGQQPARVEPEQQKTQALRNEYADWDEVFTRAKHARIADEAATALHALPDDTRGHVQYILAKDENLRGELNKLAPAEQAAEVKRLAEGIKQIRNNGSALARRLQEGLTPAERTELIQQGKRNPLGTGIVTSLMREIGYLPNAAQVAKYLLSNPDVCKPFERMNRETASVEIGRISARLENGNGHARLPVSNAPSPIKPLSGHSTNGHKPDLGGTDIDYQTFRREREKGSKERRQKGYGI